MEHCGAHLVIPVLRMLGYEGHLEFKVTLGYLVSSHLNYLVRPVSKKTILNKGWGFGQYEGPEFNK